MISESTRIAGDLKIARGSHIYVSGRVNAPPLAILENASVSPNETVLFSVEDATPGTIKTSGTTIANRAITVPSKVNSITVKSVTVESANLTVSASDITTTGTTIRTQLADATIVVTCKKLESTIPNWSSTDKVYVTGSICYIYSTTQSKDDYDTANNFLDFVYPESFVIPTADVLEKVTEYRLIVDHTFSPN